MIRFHYSSYWRKWSIEVTVDHPCLNTVEIDLGDDLNVRQHMTARDPRDETVDVLPAHVEISLAAQSLIASRQACQILAMIDWPRHRELNNGGASLWDVCKPDLRHWLPQSDESEPFDQSRQNHMCGALT